MWDKIYRDRLNRAIFQQWRLLSVAVAVVASLGLSLSQSLLTSAVSPNLAAPNTPASLGATSVVSGGYATSNKPTFGFTLSDSDAGDVVGYKIQIDDSSDFSSPVVDYNGDTLTPGSRSFTVGQAIASNESYTVGSSGQSLSAGNYYWRVRAIDSGSLTSSYATANSGAIAFRVDTTAPTVPGTPSTASPTASSTPTWTWAASTDAGAGLGSPAYSVQWSQDSAFSTGNSTGTATTNSFTQPSGLANGTWYFRAKATDAGGNSSAYSSAGNVYINSNTIVGGTFYGGQTNTQIPLADVQISGIGNPTVSLKLFVTSGMLSLTTTTGLTFTGGQSGSTLYFSGNLTDVNNALSSLRYIRSGAGTDTLEISLVNPGEVFFSGTGHLYEYVTSTTTWQQAQSQAAARSKYGANGYLTTITSQAENNFVSDRLTGAGWMGASDVATEGDWKWVTGPETGTSFWSGVGNGSTVGGNYANWNAGEPNDSSSNEDCGQFLSGGTGQWNDLPCTSTTLAGYVVEYGAPGNMPLVPAKNITITTSNDTTAPTVPGSLATNVGATTNNNKPPFTWTASTDAGVGLANPAYTVQWSQSSTFASGVTTDTTNTNAYTPATGLSDGLWYFRVRASDASNNISAYSNVISTRIDTTAPTVPGVPSTATPTNNKTPTWTWNASTDTGVGLANPAYTVQWSQSATFASGVTTSTVNTNSFTQPSNLADGTWYFRVHSGDALGANSSYSSTGSVVIDSVLPVVSAITTAPTATTNVLHWTSDKAGSSQVLYGPSSAYGSQTAVSDNVTRVTSHSVTLSGLLTCTTYHYQVVSVDVSGNTTSSADASFTTTGCAGSATVTNQSATAAPRASNTNLELKTGSTGIALAAPANFTTVDTTLQIKHLDTTTALNGINTPNGVLTAGNYVYDIKALQDTGTAITTFAKPLTITLSYVSADIEGLAESSLVIYRWDDGIGWQALDNCVVNSSAKTVTCTTNGFSTFALFGQKPVVVTTAASTTRSSAGAATRSRIATTAPVSAVAVAAATDSPIPTTLIGHAGITGEHATKQATKASGACSTHRHLIIGLVAGSLIGVGYIWWLILLKRHRRKDDETSKAKAAETKKTPKHTRN